jgi:hypothetical protein
MDSSAVGVFVNGFSEEQIPRNDCPEGFVPLEVRGLCAAGDTDVNVATVGYVVLLRGDSGIRVCISIGQNYFHFFSNLTPSPFSLQSKNLRCRILLWPSQISVL